MSHHPATRGSGLLESFLSRKRAATADRLIPNQARTGSILDIGCGTSPLFLSQTQFKQRTGIDRNAADRASDFPDLKLISHDLNADQPLPLPDEQFDIITMLAVFEHIPQPRLPQLLNETHRLLKPTGQLILTTPASWTKPILWTMARVGLVSKEEIDEHDDQYSRADIRAFFAKTNYPPNTLTFGSFELGMNTYAVAEKAAH